MIATKTISFCCCFFWLSSVGCEFVDNWAVIVDTSRYWHNYRHAVNGFAVFDRIRKLGIPAWQTIVMMGDDAACDPRNPWPANLRINPGHGEVYRPDAKVDYRATLDNFVRLLTDRWPSQIQPTQKRLRSHSKSNLLIYISGHGGSGFLKFLDSNEITSVEFAEIVEEMWLTRRYNEMLVIIDSCKSASMFDQIRSPNFVGISSSGPNEDSISHHIDFEIGAHLVDRFTFRLVEFLDKLQNNRLKYSVRDLVNCCPFAFCSSTVTSFSTLNRSLEEAKSFEFLGSDASRLELVTVKFEEL